MSVVLGFGQNETVAAEQIVAEIIEAVKSEGLDSVKRIEAEYKEQAEKYDAMSREDAPERYSYFYAYTDRRIVRLTLFHINRRHALSPDGWALLQTKTIIDFIDDEPAIYKEAEV